MYSFKKIGKTIIVRMVVMKKFLKVFLVMFFAITLVGCSCMQMTARSRVEEFLDQYRNLSANVLGDLDEVVDAEADLNEEQKEKYRDVLKKQYSDLEYEIINENYDGDTAVVETKITVYDLYKAQKDATEYLNEHSDEFNDENGTYDSSKFMDYKLDQMQKNNDTVEYTINFNLTKDDNGNWQITELSQEDLEKIHGIYNYDTE